MRKLGEIVSEVVKDLAERFKPVEPMIEEASPDPVDIPELGPDFFREVRLTKPGELLILRPDEEVPRNGFQGEVSGNTIPDLRHGMTFQNTFPSIIDNAKLRWEAGEWLVIADETYNEEVVEPTLHPAGGVVMRDAVHMRRREKIMYRGKDREEAERILIQIHEASGHVARTDRTPEGI